MIIRKNIRFASVITILALIGIGASVSARENVVSSTHRKAGKITATAAGCQPAVSAIELDINNLNARLMTGGDMWWNIGEQVAAYEIPVGSGKSSQFAASCWIGGIDQQNNLKVAAQTYRQDGNDYWPGALDVNGKITADVCANWDNFWKVNKSTINDFIQAYKSGGKTAINTSEFDVINQWPGYRNTNPFGKGGAEGANGPITFTLGNTYAPFVDLNSDGIYEPDQGEYPDISGDQFIWWVFNDAGNVKQQSLTAAIGVEVQTSGFAYSTQDYLNNASFYNYRVINRGALTIDSTYIAVWDDCDLGYYYDDFIGCDVGRGLGIQYNGTNCDGCSAGYPVNSYGSNPPQVGLDYFKGPIRQIHIPRSGLADSIVDSQLQMTNFTYYNNDFTVIGNPTDGIEIYNYMTGSIRTGQRFSDDFQGPGIQSKGYGDGPISNFVFTGDPGDHTTWSECTCNNNPGDRRFIFSSGPFQLFPGAINDITFGCIWAPNLGGCPNTSFTTIESIDDQAQALFINNFKTVEGPQAPRMVCRELDRRLIFYLVNDVGSNNYGENYGRNDKTATANYADSLQYHQKAITAPIGNPDSLYRFEGYIVYQLANSQISPSQIFDPTTGEIDNTKAIQVFECDRQDSVKTLINYVLNTSVSDTTYVPQIKVNGVDSGISHSFEITEDQFSQTSDKRLVDYQNYYYVAVAYAYNDFSYNTVTRSGGFDPKHPTTTQATPFLASAHGSNDIAIPIVVGMPNPANGAMGTIINSDYGSGIIVTRIEGQGNGGNVVELDSNSENIALSNGQVDTAVYLNSQGPINVKVIDPVLVPAYDWVLQINGTNTSAGIINSGSWTLSAFSNGNIKDVIYSDDVIGTVNEQILANYGLSVTINQVQNPGVNPSSGNGYLTSDITFSDPSQPWLWGVQDQPDSSLANWLRSGNNIGHYSTSFTALNPCNYNDNNVAHVLDPYEAYENMLANFTPTKSTWGPYDLAAAYANEHYLTGSPCGFEVAYSPVTQDSATFATLPDVDVVFTSDKTKWTRCAVIEEQETPSFAQGGASKFFLRNHASWNAGIDGNGNPVYSDIPGDEGMSWFPGYAIDEGTGQRLNIVFGEDSYMGFDNGKDMLWNPTSNTFSAFDGSIIFGGKHVVYVFGSKYDSDAVFVSNVKKAASGSATALRTAYSNAQWIGVPILNPSTSLLPLKDGLIPTPTRLRFRVNRPYAAYEAVDTTKLSVPAGVSVTSGMAANPYYSFSTSNLAPTQLSDTSNRKNLLSEIYAVPNPYYGYSGYETNRFDTRVRIINLPAQVTIYIYALDGSLVRTLSKNDPTVSYIDWDINNSVGIPVASGMYLMDVKANGIGETVLKWFGAARPIDVTTY